jgi:hypothetical protein
MCNDGVVCTTNTCVPATGCSYPSIPGCCAADAACDDHDLCTGTETCELATGLCQPGTPLDCNDHNLCNGTETCDALAGCQAGAPLTCDDEAPCTTDVCDPGMGCEYVGIPGCCMSDGDCDDTDLCTGLETCDPSHTCVAGTPLSARTRIL